MLKKKKTTASGKLVLVKSVRKTTASDKLVLVKSVNILNSNLLL